MRLLPVLSLLAMAGIVVAMMSEEKAGSHIDRLSVIGIKILGTWQRRFKSHIDQLNNTLDDLENVLTTNYSTENLPNMTMYALNLADPINTKLDEIDAMTTALGMENTGDDLDGFMYTSSRGVVSTGSSYVEGASGSAGVYTAPEDALYRITLRTDVGNNLVTRVVHNFETVLTTASHGHYYDIKTRIYLIYLYTNETISTTGDAPYVFGVEKLRIQDVRPSVL